jgi:hypothetical protein
METAAQSARESKALAVLALVNNGMTARAACNQVGDSHSAFYQFQKDRPEFIRELQDKLTGTSEELLLGILLHRVKLLEQVMIDALSDETKPMERLAIYNVMETQLDRLATTLRLSGANVSAASDDLSGPVLTPGKSRFSAGEPNKQ